jgi:predicted MFS family arabinose efflux permease
VIADAFGIRAAIWAVAGLTAASGLIVAVRMYETRPASPPSRRARDSRSKSCGTRRIGPRLAVSSMAVVSRPG